jgi:hypothetical protein
MNGFAIDADVLTALVAALIAGFAIFQAFTALRARAIPRAALWCAVTIAAGLVALFFATFQIKLM